MSIQTQAAPGDAITTFIFRLGKCTMSAKALNREVAEASLVRMWPNTKIEYVSEEFSHVVEARTTPVVGLKKGLSSYKPAKTKTISASVARLTLEERLEQKLADTFGGAA